MGANFGSRQCGRKKISGEDQSPKYKCSDYKEMYEDEGSNTFPTIPESTENLPDELEALRHCPSIPTEVLLRALQVPEDELEEGMEQQCARYRNKWTQGLLKSLNNFALASDGDLFPKKEAQEDRKKWKNSHYRGSPIPPNEDISIDKKKNAKRKKIKARTGMYVQAFSPEEKSLLSTNSLWENWNRFLSENTNGR